MPSCSIACVVFLGIRQEKRREEEVSCGWWLWCPCVAFMQLDYALLVWGEAQGGQGEKKAQPGDVGSHCHALAYCALLHGGRSPPFQKTANHLDALRSFARSKRQLPSAGPVGPFCESLDIPVCACWLRLAAGVLGRGQCLALPITSLVQIATGFFVRVLLSFALCLLTGLLVFDFQKGLDALLPVYCTNVDIFKMHHAGHVRAGRALLVPITGNPRPRGRT